MNEGVQLRRRVAETLGWRFQRKHTENGFWHHPTCPEPIDGKWNGCAFPLHVTDVKDLPVYDTDNGVALAALMEFADKHSLLWRLHGEDGQSECWFSRLSLPGMISQLIRSQHATTPALAICNAIVQAAEALEKTK